MSNFIKYLTNIRARFDNNYLELDGGPNTYFQKKSLSMLLLLNKSQNDAYCDFWRPTPISSYYVTTNDTFHV